MRRSSPRVSGGPALGSAGPMIFALLPAVAAMALASCNNVNEENTIYPELVREELKIAESCPAADQTGVSTSTVISLTFNKDLIPASVTTSAVLLGTGNALVRGEASYSDRTVTYIPLEPLAPNLIYVTTDLRDVDYFAMTDQLYVQYFTTGPGEGGDTCR